MSRSGVKCLNSFSQLPVFKTSNEMKSKYPKIKKKNNTEAHLQNK